jgi:hypothetical protein
VRRSKIPVNPQILAVDALVESLVQDNRLTDALCARRFEEQWTS